MPILSPSKRMSGGYIMILNVVLFIAIVITIIIGVVNPILAHYASAKSFLASKQAYITAHSGVEEAYYRLRNGISMPSTLTYTNGTSSSAAITVTNTSAGKTLLSIGDTGSYSRRIELDISLGTGISFHYGIQSGNGGFSLSNTSSVTGNVYSSGSVTGGGNIIAGDVVSAGASGLINGITATGTAYAHTIQNSTIQKTAYYMSIDSASTVNGSMCPNASCYPNSPDLPTVPLPISDSQISQWESDAAGGGTASCSGGTFSPSNNTTLGPIKVPCDLSIKNVSVTIDGPVWVTGNITVKGSTVQMSNTLNSQNVAIIADNPLNTTGSGLISVDTSSTFYAAGCPASCIPGAYVFLISQNNSAEQGGSTPAITPGQSSTGLVTYASHGLITVGNSVHLKEVTAYEIAISNSANVTYDTGLGSSLFEAGPGGSYNVVDWLEY